MCFSFLNCVRKKKKHFASTVAIAPRTIQNFEKPEDSDSLESLKASIGELGIPIAKERFYENIGGILIFKNDSLNEQSWEQVHKRRILNTPVESRIKMARDSLMSV